jgi:hypothetical protein
LVHVAIALTDAPIDAHEIATLPWHGASRQWRSAIERAVVIAGPPTG